jgi:fatty acid desaturase
LALSARQRRFLSLLWRLSFPFLAINERIGLWRSSLSCSRARERLCACAALSGYLVLACACPFVAPLWAVFRVYLPALFLLMVCEELINLPHHIEAKTVAHKLALWQQAEVTHSLADVPLWSRFVLLHFNLHTAHHLFPALPWFRLERASRALARYGLHSVREHELSASLRLRRRRFVEVFADYLRGTQP